MASRNLGSLTLDLILKMGGFQQGMDRAARETDKFQKKVSGSFAKVAGAFKGLAGVFGAGLGLNALRGAAAEAIEYGDEINKASIKTGIAVEQFSELAYAAKQNDIELAGLSTGLKKMQIALSEAGSGSKAANETLAALGLTIKDLQDLSPDKQFELLADRIAALKEPADRTRAAVDLFGKAGADLLPLFEKGALGIRELREEAQRMGATLTGEQAKALAEADDAIKRLGQSWDGVTRSLTSVIALPLAAFLNGVTDALNSQTPPLERAANLWVKYLEIFSAGPLGAGIKLLKEFTAAAHEAANVEPIETPLLGTGLAPGGRNRKPSAPGFLPEPDAPKKLATSKANSDALRAQAAAAREAEQALQDQADAYKDVLDAGQRAMDELRTPLEEQIDQYHEAKFALEQLAATYPNLADQANEALKRLETEGFEEIEITAKLIPPPPEEIEKITSFLDEAQRNAQGVLADFLFDPFSEGLDGLAQKFGEVLQRMAAEAVAAQLAEKLFGGMSEILDDLGKQFASIFSGSGAGGLLGSLGSLFGGGGGGIGTINGFDFASIGLATGGMVDGSGGGVLHGPGTGTSDSIPALTRGGKPLLLSSGEHITRAAVVREPGAESFLAAFNRYGMETLDGLMGFATGGRVPADHFGIVSGARMSAANSGASRQASEPMTVSQTFILQAPQGTVSRATQQQVGASAFRGAARAAGRSA